MSDGNSDVRPRVLVVDDEKPIGRVIWHGLSRHFQIVYESVSALALTRLEDESELFDVTFLDIIMPDLNGMVLYERLKTTAPARCDRIVFITGGAGIPAVKVFLQKHHHIEKPFRLEELEAVIEVYSESKLPRGPR
jgi:two-component system NtrC family sensor kinase